MRVTLKFTVMDESMTREKMEEFAIEELCKLTDYSKEIDIDIVDVDIINIEE